jgi:hypothetical protein
MESIKWHFMATPERVEKLNRTKRFMKILFHYIGILYLIILIFDSFTFGLTVQLVFVYIVGLAIWYLFLEKVLVFGEKIYTLTDQGFEVFEIRSNITNKYKWDEFKSFSKGIDKLVSISSDLNFYLLRKVGQDIRIVIEVDKNYVERVYNFIKTKLPEAGS